MNLTSEMHTPTAMSARPAPSRQGVIVVGSGEPVVLLHSSMSSKKQWEAMTTRLAPRHRVIAVDLHGYGDNALPLADAEFELDDEVDLVAARVNAVVDRHTPIHLVGHSYGAIVALRFAHQHPGRVRSLSLYEPVAFQLLDRDDTDVKQMREIHHRMRHLLAAKRADMAAQMFFDFWNGGGAFAALAPELKAKLAVASAKVVFDFHAVQNARLTLADCRTISTGTLLLGGSRSHAITQRIVALLARTLPNARSAWVDGDHMAPINSPTLVNPLIDAFIDLVIASRTQAATANLAMRLSQSVRTSTGPL